MSFVRKSGKEENSYLGEIEKRNAEYRKRLLAEKAAFEQDSADLGNLAISHAFTMDQPENQKSLENIDEYNDLITTFDIIFRSIGFILLDKEGKIHKKLLSEEIYNLWDWKTVFLSNIEEAYFASLLNFIDLSKHQNIFEQDSNYIFIALCIPPHMKERIQSSEKYANALDDFNIIYDEKEHFASDQFGKSIINYRYETPSMHNKHIQNKNIQYNNLMLVPDWVIYELASHVFHKIVMDLFVSHSVFAFLDNSYMDFDEKITSDEISNVIIALCNEFLDIPTVYTKKPKNYPKDYNIIKAIKKFNLNPRYDLWISDIANIIQIWKNATSEYNIGIKIYKNDLGDLEVLKNKVSGAYRLLNIESLVKTNMAGVPISEIFVL